MSSKVINETNFLPSATSKVVLLVMFIYVVRVQDDWRSCERFSES